MSCSLPGKRWHPESLRLAEVNSQETLYSRLAVSAGRTQGSALRSAEGGGSRKGARIFVMGPDTLVGSQALVTENEGAQRALRSAVGNLGEMGSRGHPCPACPMTPFSMLHHVQLMT